ncbi:MAG: hypothetical protein C4526_06025 [Nitrospiraceae bacterium]|nr:MAG: hypothetical protein C4526_06025 [Nitrospiraceae bacterium]
MQILNSILNTFFDLVLAPMRSFNPFWSLFIFSVPAGILLVLIFRYTSDQGAIRETKDRIKGHMLEIRLFKDNPGVLMSAFGSILVYNFKYMRHAVRPMLFMVVPVLFMLVQLDAWYGYRPLRTGESAVFSVRLSGSDGRVVDNITLQADDGLTVETPPLRIPEEKEADWRIRADKAGNHKVAVRVRGKTVEKTITVSGNPGRVSVKRTSAGFWERLFNPGEKPIPEDSGIKEISVEYPLGSIYVLGWSMHWLMVFFLLTLITGFAFKGFFRVEL